MFNPMVEEYIRPAFDALKQYGIAWSDEADGGALKIYKGFRGKIAAYGAAITMGSLLAGTAFYSAQGNADQERQNLMRAIYVLLQPENARDPARVRDDALFLYVADHNDHETRERVIAVATALKLAMNLYPLVQDKTDTVERAAEEE